MTDNSKDLINIASIINNPINHLDQAINFKIVNTIGLLINKFDIKNVGLLIVLLGVEPIKKEIVTKIPELSKSLYLFIKKHIILVKDKIYNILFKCETTVIAIDNTIEYSNKYNINLSCDLKLMLNLLKYAIKTNNLMINEACEVSMIQDGRDRYIKKIIIYNLTIKKEDIIIQVGCNINANLLYTNTSDINDFKIIETSKIDYNNITNFIIGKDNIFELLPFLEFYEDIKKFRLTGLYSDDDFNSTDTYCNIVKTIVNALHLKYKFKCSKITTAEDIEILFNTGYIISPRQNSITGLFNRSNSLKMFNTDIDISKCGNYNYIRTISECRNTNIRQKDLVGEMIRSYIANNNTTTTTTNVFNTIPIEIRSNNNSKNLRIEWIHFLKEINTNNSLNIENQEDINIWDMKVLIEKKIIIEGSPKKQ